LLDTGASEVVIPGEIAQQFHLKPGREGIARTAAGNVIIYDTFIDEIIVGHIVLRNVKANISPSMKGSDVLLGMSALQKIHFVQEDNALILSLPTR